MSEKKLLLIAGYGGHAGYTYSIAWYLNKLGFNNNTILVARGYEFLAGKFENFGEVEYLFLPRKPGEPLYKGLHRWINAFIQSTRSVLKSKPRAVFASGSNFSIPPSLVSKILLKTPVYTLETIERFTTKSRAVDILVKTGAKVFLHWEEQLELFPRGIVSGPVYEPRIYEPRNQGYILVTTGTLGYKELFDTISQLGLENIVLQTGDVDPEPYKKKHPSWTVFQYTSDIHKWIAGADIVIAHQGGATTSTARFAYGKPVIIVYNPRVSLGASKKDVEIYAEKIKAVFLDKPDPRLLRRAIDEVEKTSLNYENGALFIAKKLLEHLEK